MVPKAGEITRVGKPISPMASVTRGIFGLSLAGGQDAAGVGWLARRGDELIDIGRNFLHALQHWIERRRGFKVMPRNDQVGFRAQFGAAGGDYFGGFDFDIDGARSALDGQFENA